MGLLGKKYKTDASGNKVRIADKGYEKEYLKKTKKYIFDMTGKESKATTSAEARKEAGQTPGSKKPVAKWQGYKQDTRIEVPNKETFAESRNIFGGKAGKAKRKRRRKTTGDTKLVKVKNAKHAAKLHKKREEAGMTKTTVKGAKDKSVKENFPMSEEDKNYILTGKDRPTEESIKKKVKAAKAKDSVQELKETGVNAKEKKGGKPYILTQEDKDYINALSPAAYRNLTGKYRPGKKPKDKLIKAEENKPLTKEEEEKRLDAKAQKNYRRLIKEGPWW